MAYELDGVEYPSVTSILGLLEKPALIGWAANCAVDYVEDHLNDVRNTIDVHIAEGVLKDARKAHTVKKDAAADAGTLCHKAIELYIGTRSKEDASDFVGLNEQARTGLEAFFEWESANQVEWLESEVEVVSVMRGYAGRFDAIARVNGLKYLIDFKTSKGIYDEMKYQQCAYQQAYNESLEEGQEPVERLALLHLDKETGEPTFKPIIKDIQRMTELFNHLVVVYYLLKNRRLKNNPFVKAAKEIGEPIEIGKELMF